MRTLYCIIFLLFATCICASGAEKAVTQDPNAGGAVTAEVDQVSDQRLAQKVTCQSGYKRLHNVTDELTTATGVTIYSGESSKNWQVRDIPLVVCVKDMPLGKLLDAIADATHTAVTSFKPEGEQERTYRLYRVRTIQKGIDDYFKEKDREFQLVAQWNWDVLAKLKDIPDNVSKYGIGSPLKEAKALSAALATLGPDAKDRFFAGECLRIPGDTPAGAELIRAMRQRQWETQPADRKQQPYQESTAEELAKTTYGIQINLQNPNFGVVDIKRELVNGKSTSWEMGAVSEMVSSVAADVERSGLLPKRPNFDEQRALVDALPGPDYQKVSPHDPAMPEELQAKIRIELPKEITDPNWTDVVQAVAKASGYNIIAEDFQSHHQVLSPNARGLIGSETTLVQALAALDCNWMLDEKSQLLIGWVDVWQSSHTNLVPESTLSNLQQKLEGSGVELDDILPVAQLTRDQTSEWITNNRHLRPLFPEFLFRDPDYGPLWLLYSLLDEPRQAQTKSDAGLPLAGIDQSWLHSTLAAVRRLYGQTFIKHGDTQGEQLSELLSDPAVLRTLTMKMKTVPQTQQTEITYTDDGGIQTRSETIAPNDKRHTYLIELTGRKDDAPFAVKTNPLDAAFPIYSPAHEKEILEQSQKQQ